MTKPKSTDETEEEMDAIGKTNGFEIDTVKLKQDLESVLIKYGVIDNFPTPSRMSDGRLALSILLKPAKSKSERLPVVRERRKHRDNAKKH